MTRMKTAANSGTLLPDELDSAINDGNSMWGWRPWLGFSANVGAWNVGKLNYWNFSLWDDAALVNINAGHIPILFSDFLGNWKTVCRISVAAVAFSSGFTGLLDFGIGSVHGLDGAITPLTITKVPGSSATIRDLSNSLKYAYSGEFPAPQDGVYAPVLTPDAAISTGSVYINWKLQIKRVKT